MIGKKMGAMQFPVAPNSGNSMPQTMHSTVSCIFMRLCVAAGLAAVLLAPWHKGFAMGAPVMVAIGKQAPLGEFGLTLNRATLAGCEITIAYSVKNIGPTPAPLARLPALWLEDRKGALLAAAEDSARERILAPGETAIRAARFALPRGAADPMAWLLRVGGELGPRSTLR